MFSQTNKQLLVQRYAAARAYLCSIAHEFLFSVFKPSSFQIKTRGNGEIFLAPLFQRSCSANCPKRSANALNTFI
jgi:hypothetical protein